MRLKTFLFVLLLIFSNVCFAENLSKYFLTNGTENTDDDWKDQNAYQPYPILFVHGLAGHSSMWGGPKPPDNKGSILELKKYFKPYQKYQEEISPGVYPKVLLSKDKPNESDKWFTTYNTTYLETIEFSDNNMHPVDEAKELAYRIFGPVSWVPSEWSKPLDITQTDFKPVLQEYYSDSPSQWKPSDKIILICHSMGGLTSRDYISHLSRKENFAHHIAKLITVDTPHWGSMWATLNMEVRTFADEQKLKGLTREAADDFYNQLLRIVASGAPISAEKLEKFFLCRRIVKAWAALDFVDGEVKMKTEKDGIKATDPTYNHEPPYDTVYADRYKIDGKQSYVEYLRKKYPLAQASQPVSFWTICGIYKGGIPGEIFDKPIAGIFNVILSLGPINIALNKKLKLSNVPEWNDGDGVVSRASQQYKQGEIFSYLTLTGETEEQKSITIDKSVFHSRLRQPWSGGPLRADGSYDQWEYILQALDDTMEMKVVTPDPDWMENLATKDLYCAVKFGDYLPADVVMKVYVDGVDKTGFLPGAEVSPHPIDARETTITENGKYNSGFSFTLHNLEHGQRYITIELTNAAKLANPANTEAGVRIEKSFYVNVPDVTIAQLKYEDADGSYRPVPAGTAVILTEIRPSVNNPADSNNYRTLVEDYEGSHTVDSDSQVQLTLSGGPAVKYRLTLQGLNDKASVNLNKDTPGLIYVSSKETSKEVLNSGQEVKFTRIPVKDFGFPGFARDVIAKRISDSGRIKVLDSLSMGYDYLARFTPLSDLRMAKAVVVSDTPGVNVSRYDLASQKILLYSQKSDHWNSDKTLQAYGSFLLNRTTDCQASYAPRWGERSTPIQALINGFCPVFSSRARDANKVTVRTAVQTDKEIDLSVPTTVKGVDNEAAIAYALAELGRFDIIWRKIRENNATKQRQVKNINDVYELLKGEDFTPLTIGDIFVKYGLKPKLISVDNTNTTRPKFTWSRNDTLGTIPDWDLEVSQDENFVTTVYTQTAIAAETLDLASVNSPIIPVGLGAGQYYWRVEANTAEVEDFYSLAGQFSITPGYASIGSAGGNVLLGRGSGSGTTPVKGKAMKRNSESWENDPTASFLSIPAGAVSGEIKVGVTTISTPEKLGDYQVVGRTLYEIYPADYSFAKECMLIFPVENTKGYGIYRYDFAAQQWKYVGSHFAPELIQT